MPGCPKRVICGDNFPTYNVDLHIGRSFAQCPFSTQAPEKRVRLMLRDLILENGGLDIAEINMETGEYEVSDYDAEILTTLGYSRNDHTTVSGNRESDNPLYISDDYLKNPTFSGTVYMMTDSRRGQYGYECAFNNCSYRQNNGGRRYFYS